MRIRLAVTLGLLMGGCTVPETNAVLLERFCAEGGHGDHDQSLRLESDAACDRGLTVELKATGFRPGCVRVSLRDTADTTLGSLLIAGVPGSEPDWTARLGITLSETQGENLVLSAVAFERVCDETRVANHFSDIKVVGGTLQTRKVLFSAKDADGDGKAGLDLGVSCVSPLPRAVTVSDDCDESSRLVANGLSETCDRLDNDCDGLPDNGLSCAATSWKKVEGAGFEDLSAVAAYDQGGAWFISGANEDMFALDGGIVVPVLGACAGGDQGRRAAWAGTTGQLLTVDQSRL